MMSKKHPINRLQKQLVNLISLEAAIEQKLEELVPAVSDNAEVAALLSGFLSLPRDQRKALEARLSFLTDSPPEIEYPSAISFAGDVNEGKEYPVTGALQSAYTLFNQAVISYSVMHALATRFLDSPYAADEGTALHLARQHTHNYIQAIQQISRFLHDAVLWELDQEGLECECICPSCGVGICLCSMSGRAFLSKVWEEAGPILKDEGIYVQLPKRESPAAKAGLQKGDLILSGDDREIYTIEDMFEVINEAGPGGVVKMNVRRKSEETEETVNLHI
ncbi:MAG: PDZ domain-containing protein [Chloroflexi bacterium]|jgi:hypothetical protein|nr:PDZ domain-containing protein [Chloroflexota bacterium]